MHRPLKIGFVVPGIYVYFNPSTPWPPGGSERQAYLLARTLAASGDAEVHCAVANFGQPVRESPSPRLYLWRSFRYDQPRMTTLWQFLATLRAINPDVFVFRSASVGTAIGMSLAVLACRKPVVYMIAHDDEADNRRMATSVGLGGALAMTYAYALPSAICAQSDAQRLAFEAHRSRRVAAVIPNACELPSAATLLHFAARDTVLWVGRAQEWKRGDSFIALARQFPKIPFVMICSPSDARVEARWRAAAGSVSNLEWHGSLPHSDLASHYARARLFVSTARAEGVPNTMLEAMAAGCPVLSAAVDPAEALSAHGAGRCLNDLDNEALARACNDMLMDSRSLEAMGAAARAFVAGRHTPSVAATALMNVLRDVCGV